MMDEKKPGMSPLLDLFEYRHLPPQLQEVSQSFAAMALLIEERRQAALGPWLTAETVYGGEREVSLINSQADLALTHLVQAKDAAVRAALYATKLAKLDPLAPAEPGMCGETSGVTGGWICKLPKGHDGEHKSPAGMTWGRR